MDDKKADQERAIALLTEWGFDHVKPAGGHRVVGHIRHNDDLDDGGCYVIVWCVTGVLAYADRGVSATWCPRHTPHA